MRVTTPAVGSTHHIYTHPTRKIETWGEQVEVVLTGFNMVFFKSHASRKNHRMEAMTRAQWAEATAK